MPPPNGWVNPYATGLLNMWEWVIIAQYILMGIPILGQFASFIIGLVMTGANVVFIVQDWDSTFEPYLSGD